MYAAHLDKEALEELVLLVWLDINRHVVRGCDLDLGLGLGLRLRASV